MSKITATFIIEIAGKPVENVAEALKRVKQRFESDENNYFDCVSCEYNEPELDEETTLYNGFLEFTGKFDETENLFSFIADYTPTSIEIEDPEEFAIDANELSGILNDVSALLLKSNTFREQLRAKVNYLTKKLQEAGVQIGPTQAKPQQTAPKEPSKKDETNLKKTKGKKN